MHRQSMCLRERLFQGLVLIKPAAALARQRCGAQPVRGAGGGEAARDGVPERAAVQQRLRRTYKRYEQ